MGVSSWASHFLDSSQAFPYSLKKRPAAHPDFFEILKTIAEQFPEEPSLALFLPDDSLFLV